MSGPQPIYSKRKADADPYQDLVHTDFKKNRESSLERSEGSEKTEEQTAFSEPAALATPSAPTPADASFPSLIAIQSGIAPEIHSSAGTMIVTQITAMSIPAILQRIERGDLDNLRDEGVIEELLHKLHQSSEVAELDIKRQTSPEELSPGALQYFELEAKWAQLITESNYRVQYRPEPQAISPLETSMLRVLPLCTRLEKLSLIFTGPYADKDAAQESLQRILEFLPATVQRVYLVFDFTESSYNPQGNEAMDARTVITTALEKLVQKAHLAYIDILIEKGPHALLADYREGLIEDFEATANSVQRPTLLLKISEYSEDDQADLVLFTSNDHMQTCVAKFNELLAKEGDIDQPYMGTFLETLFPQSEDESSAHKHFQMDATKPNECLRVIGVDIATIANNGHVEVGFWDSPQEKSHDPVPLPENPVKGFIYLVNAVLEQIPATTPVTPEPSSKTPAPAAVSSSS